MRQLGKRVRELIQAHAATVKFFAPDVAYADARKYLPALLAKRGVDPIPVMLVLDALDRIVHSMDTEVYGGLQQQALRRIEMRDADDWPVLAFAMVLSCPVLDRGCRFLRYWCRNLDYRPNRAASGRRIAPRRSEVEIVEALSVDEVVRRNADAMAPTVLTTSIAPSPKTVEEV